MFGCRSELSEPPELGVKKILIVDWDVHHGNGSCFCSSPFIGMSLGPFTLQMKMDLNYTMVGEGPGAGYNTNVPWENGRCGDADYLAAWDHILIPVAKEFDTVMIVVSAGFDAAVGDLPGFKKEEVKVEIEFDRVL
ncbi:Histone deacetylase 5 [Turnera subulata]|uniref:Histone deacetylase 5 n=1 Tax=Turnera subulata TaxID=218843 RepID=A0A9Q0JET5_9ROSI|nr:Histone deacetylase 5 [Turnera subulata]